MEPNRDKGLNHMDPQIDHFVGAKLTHWEKDNLFNIGYWTHRIST